MTCDFFFVVVTNEDCKWSSLNFMNITTNIKRKEEGGGMELCLMKLYLLLLLFFADINKVFLFVLIFKDAF